MADEHFIYQTSDLTRSFRTTHPRALINKVPWVITRKTPMSQALSLLFEEGYADLMVVDEESGRLLGVFSNLETTTTLASKKKKEKKATASMLLQENCRKECDTACATRGGCRSCGVADYGDGPLCTIICNDDENNEFGDFILDRI